ncbi:MAG TPA: hypothetical protein VF791_12180 [Pyrinomonadaceae bacterium]
MTHPSTAKASVLFLPDKVLRDPSDPFNSGSGVPFVKELFHTNRP